MQVRHENHEILPHHENCNFLDDSIFFLRLQLHVKGAKISIKLFSRPWRIVPKPGVNEGGRKGVDIPSSSLEAELRGGGPFAMRVTPHPPRYLPPSRRAASYIPIRAVGDAHAARRGQNLSAMHDRSVAYRLRRAARHYARGKQKDERLTAGQSPFAC